MIFRFTSTKSRLFQFSQVLISHLRISLFFFIIAIVFQSEKISSQTINIDSLQLDDEIFSSGKYLINRQYGLHSLDSSSEQIDTVFVAVHGFGSRGFEWVYALRKMTASNNKTYFYRWDWSQCPNQASSTLYKQLRELIISNPQIKHIKLFGHSYGGNVVTGISNKPNLGSIEIHSIAGALMPIDRHRKQCPNFNGFENYELLYPHFQWRTVKDQDGAFRNMPFDPQIVNIDGSTVVNLPPVFENGQRLGHNWSLKWVFDKYFEK